MSVVAPFPSGWDRRAIASFDRRELNRILDLYGRMVAAGHWRDYALLIDPDVAVFAAFRRRVMFPLGPVLGLDLGGGSLELALGDVRHIRREWTLRLGAARLRTEGGVVTEARIVLNAVGPRPLLCEEAGALLVGQAPTPDLLQEAATRAARLAKPHDNTDHLAMWRKQVVKVEVRRALETLTS